MTELPPNPKDHPHDLAIALLAGIDHFKLPWGEQAAIQLLIADRTWLRRSEVLHYITTRITTDGYWHAWVDWPAVAEEPDHSPASSSERALLRLACHLAGNLPKDTDHAWSIENILSRLDAEEAILASRAVAMAALGPDTVGPLT